MSGFNQDDGFFQSGHYDQQQQSQGQQQQQQYAGYDYSGQQFGQEQQFGQFEYSQQAGYGGGGGGGGGAGAQYSGSIMTPASPYTAPPSSPGEENYEDELPLMEELGINFDHITQKVSPYSCCFGSTKGSWL
ncbi:hypothetical protein ACOMHN_023972 [Nucella lapillus]